MHHPKTTRPSLLGFSAGLGSLFVLGCAGPTTPLGAIWSFRVPTEIRDVKSLSRTTESLSSLAHIEISPTRQVLHASHPLTVRIDDPEGIQGGYRLAILYNGLDVTTTFLRQANVTHSKQGSRLTVKVPRVNLPAGWEHRIEIAYFGATGSFARASFDPPVCLPFAQSSVQTTFDFDPSPKLLAMIDRVSRENGFNPAFTAGLIAQESSFEPTTVSWAKAIGLTQMTPIAEAEIASKIGSWPRYPGINDIPVAWVKGLIITGEVNSQNEWRLNEERSIRGGLAYTQYLFARWSAPENAELLKASFTDPASAIPKLVLASYNSGYGRVFGALNKAKGDWLSTDEMKGVRRYINRIQSYCDHFSEPENNDEKPT